MRHGQKANWHSKAFVSSSPNLGALIKVFLSSLETVVMCEKSRILKEQWP